MSTSKTYQQSLADASSETRPPMLESGSYIPGITIDDLFYYLQQFKKLVNVSRAKKLEKSHDPLALNEYQHDDVHTNSEDPLASAMLLLARAITQKKFTPTNNRLRTSSNTRNQAIIQGDRVNIQSRNSGHYTRNCPKLRVRDSKYFMEQMLLAKPDEAGVILTDEQNDFLFADASRMEEIEELSANIFLMARIQPADNTSDVGPSYDSAFISEVQSSSNNENKEQMYLTHTKIINSTIGDDQIDNDIIFDSPNGNVNSNSIEKDTHVPDLCALEQLARNAYQEAEKQQIFAQKNCWSIDYAQINALYKDFVPQEEISAEQKYFPSSFISSDKNSNATPSIPASMPIQALIQECDNVKLEYQKLFNSIKKTRSQTQTEIDELIAHVSEKTHAYGDIRAENRNLLFTISELKTRLANVEKGMNVASSVRRPMNRDLHVKNSVLANSKQQQRKVAFMFSKESTLSKSLDTTYVVSKPKIDVGSTSKANDKVVQIVLWIVDSNLFKAYDGLSHLNFGTINDLSRLDLVDGLPKFKYGKDHLCSAYEIGKRKKASHPLKLVPNETPEIIKKFIAQAQLNYKAKVCKIRTYNGTEFKNATLKAHYEKLGIMQQFLTARTPQQNGVVKRRNRTLVEAARTMLIFSRLPEFLWAEAVATACFTQNRNHS
ncbi:integrase, catalytic region, zinc finger, CCHC-type containing protein [Tanacetum coccineum]|uniref:Integrase, catalytic region, zinc finger, CCHC-type containing protein n=1 Tax=Tanacetum coccineum TaxID=301880 RepID=A0ABQ5G540_9ASTR